MKNHSLKMFQRTLQAVTMSLLGAIAAQNAFGSSTIFGWGDSNYGQATGATNGIPPYFLSGPTMVPPGQVLSDVVVAGGAFHSLALKSDGTVLAWGSDD